MRKITMILFTLIVILTLISPALVFANTTKTASVTVTRYSNNVMITKHTATTWWTYGRKYDSSKGKYRDYLYSSPRGKDQSYAVYNGTRKIGSSSGWDW